jgi:hypothetical protein
MSMTDRGPGDGKLTDARQVYLESQRRLEQIRSEMARAGEREWRDLFGRMHMVLRAIHGNRRVMADAESYRILSGLCRAGDLEDLNHELKQLAERLVVLAESPLEGGGQEASGRPSGGERPAPTGARPPLAAENGLAARPTDRLRLRL